MVPEIYLRPLAGADVTLNFGLSKDVGFTRNSIPHRLRTLTKLLPVILEPGYITELVLVPTRVWHGEPLLIVQGTFKQDIADHTLLYDGVVEAEQDCIAIYCHDDFPDLSFSILYGPKAEEWGGFNINLFNFIGDKHE
jgi:hypothetical protein